MRAFSLRPSTFRLRVEPRIVRGIVHCLADNGTLRVQLHSKRQLQDKMLRCGVRGSICRTTSS